MVSRVEQTFSGQREVPFTKKIVLVIDDDPAMLDVDKDILEMAGYEVLTAQSGDEALALLTLDTLNKVPPDLILLDQHLQDITGTEFLKILEKKFPDLLKMTPVVFLTAMDSVPVSGAIGFIQKPFKINYFLASVHQFITIGAEERNNDKNELY